MLKLKKVLCIIFILFITILPGCTKAPVPQDSYNNYISNWKNMNFASMYVMLSTDSKSQINEKEFIANLKSSYTTMGVSRINLKSNLPEKIVPDKDGKVNLPVSVSFDTVAGKIEFTQDIVLVKEKINKSFNYYIVWNYHQIIPGLDNGDKIVQKKTNSRRGSIFDRNGKILATDGLIENIGIVPEKLPQNIDSSKQQIAKILNITVDQINRKLGASWVKPNMFVPIDYVSQDDNDKISKLKLVPGVSIQGLSARVYPYKEAAAHLTGYVQKITAAEIDKYKEDDYSTLDLIGKAGLELAYEKRLKGISGRTLYIVDSKNIKKQTVLETTPVNGENIKLTIDIDLQLALYNQLKGEAGTSVAISPSSGEVLSLVSSPAYDPNMFILGFSNAKWQSIVNDPNKPMLNRTTKAYTPGSTFKLITGAIGLKSGKITADKTRDISGLSWKGDPGWGNYSVTRVPDPINPVNLLNAYIYSDNIYFAQTAYEIGSATFISEAKNFGIGEKIDFPLILDISKLSNDGSFDKDTQNIQLADSGYGQAQVTVNPINMAVIYATILNKGNLISPVLEVPADGNIKILHPSIISEDICNILKNDLKQVIENPNGTAHAAFVDGASLGGKTGTAEIKLSQTDKTGKENGWFVVFNTEKEKPLIVTMIEDVKDKGGSHYVVNKIKNILLQFEK